MRTLKKLFKFAATVLILLCIAGGLFLYYTAHTRLPMLDGTVAHPSLKAPVNVLRDEWGVPHISAQHETDAYFALGYVMAQDRLFQMELFLRLARGEMAELLGSPLVPVDTVARAFRLRQKAEEYVATAHGKYPELAAVTEAFTAGINHRIASEPLPFEYVILQIPPRTFTPADCLTVAAILPITFADGLREDPLNAILQQQHPDLDMNLLFPGYSRDTPPITVMESIEEAQALWAERQSAAGQPAEKTAAALRSKIIAALDAWLAPLQSLSEHLGPAMGSNSWVLSGDRSASGKPLLASDPHIGFTNPSIWYEAHLRYADVDIYGHHLPLIPLALLMHNAQFGWALTMFANDDVDLYVETFDKNDPGRVMYKGEWVEAKIEPETIRVRFGADRRTEVRTTPHGPLVTDLLRLMHEYEGPDVALQWVWQRLEYTDMVAFYRMARAKSYDDFAAAVALITSPGLNISYADADGNIAWWAAGRLPIRPPHVNPKTLLDGASGADDILGYVPVEQNPHLKNPPSGYIVTANNMSTVKPVGEVDLLEGYWQPGDRAARIEHLLEQQPTWDVDSLKPVQFDDGAHAAQAIIASWLPILDRASDSFSREEAKALAALKSWDLRYGIGSAGASVYTVTCDAILEHMLIDELGAYRLRVYHSLADHWNFFKWAVKEESLPFWDDRRTDAVESRSDIILAAWRSGIAGLTADLGPQVEQWGWGRIHTMEFKHPFGYIPLFSRIFNIGPFPASGAAQVINNMLYAPTNRKYEVIAGPSTRRLIDFANPEAAQTVLPTGNSGNFMSPHYDDQAPLFMRGEYRPARLNPDDIQKHARHRLDFKPGA